jgi:PAS domain S-box-containing protein
MEATTSVPLDLTTETRAVLETLPVAITAGAAVRDETGRIVDLLTVYVNAEAERATGVPREQQVGIRLCETVPGFRESELFAKLVRLVETGRISGGYETPWWRGDRGMGIFHAEATRFGDGYVAVFRDVTAARRAESELRASEARLADAQRIAQVGSWDWDIAGSQLHWSDELYRIYGISQSEYTPSYDGYMMRVHPEDRDRVAGVVQRAMAEGGSFTFDERIVRPDGTVRVLHSGGNVRLDAKGRPARMLGVCLDVTERAETERQLAEARADLERRRFAERQAAQINEGIIEGLVDAMRALDRADYRAVGDAMRQTFEQASRIVTDLRAAPDRGH